MKKLIFASLIALTLSIPALAASNWGNCRPDFDALFQEWNLTPEQVDQVQSYMQQHREARQALRQQDFNSREERFAAMQEQREQYRQNLSQVLTPEQQQQLDDYMKQFRQGRGGHRGHKGGDRYQGSDS